MYGISNNENKACNLYPVAQVEHLIGIDRLLRHRVPKVLQAAIKPALGAVSAVVRALLKSLLVMPTSSLWCWVRGRNAKA